MTTLERLRALDDYNVRVAERRATALRCDETIVQLTSITPETGDLVPVFHNGNTYAATVGAIIGTPATATGTYSVLKYGATGNGATDDTGAIQAAVNAAHAAGGGDVFFPATSAFYSVTSAAGQPAVTIPGNNIRLIGNGASSTIQLATTAPTTAYIFNALNVVAFEMRNLVIAGNPSAAPGTGVIYFGLVQLSSASQCVFDNLFFINSASGMLAFDNSTKMTISNCRFHTSGLNATAAFFCPMVNVGVNTLSTWVTVKNCEFRDALFHALWMAATDSLVDGCIFDRCGESRIVASPRTTVVNCEDNNGYMVSSTGPFIEAFADGMVIANNKVYNAGQFAGRYALSPNQCAGIFALGGNTVVDGNTVVNCTSAGIYPWKSVIGPNNPLSGQNITISNNVVVGNGTLSSETPGTFVAGGIIFLDVSGGNYSNVSVIGNACSGNGGIGDIQYAVPINTATFAAVGNSSSPDRIVVNGSTLTGTTAITLLESIPIAAGAVGLNGGFNATHRSGLLLTGTAQFIVGYGGETFLAFTGTYQIGDTITYNLNGTNVVYTVVVGETSLSAIATGVAAAINASGLNTLVSAAKTTQFAFYNSGNTASGNVIVTALDAAFALGTNLTNTIATSSAAGVVHIGNSGIIYNVLNYTSGAALGATNMRIDVSVLDSFSLAFQNTGVQAWLGTTMVANATFGTSADDSIPQTIRCYAKLSNGGDTMANNVMQYTLL